MSLGENFTSGVVESFGYKIPYVEAGKGEILVSLPGSAGLEMSTAKDELAKSYRVIEFDPPGWGTTTPLEGRMRQRDLAVVLAAALTEMGIDRFHLLGTSMGGTNAYWLASQFPDRVKSIILDAPMLFTGPDELVDPSGLQMIEALVGGMPMPDMSGYPAPPPHPNKPWADADFFREQMRRRFVMMAKSDRSCDAPELRAFASATAEKGAAMTALDIDPITFRNAMSRVAASVNIITTERDGTRRGCTATAVCSLSDTPASLIVCLNRQSGTGQLVRSSGVLGVNL